jgi:hypothetical protein
MRDRRSRITLRSIRATKLSPASPSYFFSATIAV